MHRTSGRMLLIVAAFVLFLVPVAAIAGTSMFEDVSDDNIFVDDINWMKTSGITKGCNPAGTEYCPEDKVSRQQMAAFMHRLATSRAVDAGTVEGMTAAELKGQTGDTGPAGADGVSGLEQVTGERINADVKVGDALIVVAHCPAGKEVTGGGGFASHDGVAARHSFPAADLSSWEMGWTATEAMPTITVWAYAVCADVATP